jgi:hypothetical protein
MFHVYRYIYRLSVTLGGLVLVIPATSSSSEASTCAESRETWRLLTSHKILPLILMGLLSFSLLFGLVSIRLSISLIYKNYLSFHFFECWKRRWGRCLQESLQSPINIFSIQLKIEYETIRE